MVLKSQAGCPKGKLSGRLGLQMQPFTDFIDQCLDGERFVKKGRARIERGMKPDLLVGVPRHENHLGVWTDLGNPRRQFQAAHVRQNDIEQQEMDRTGMLLAKTERLPSIAGFHYGESLSGQSMSKKLARLRLIIDDEDGPGHA
jgi:hypothetical protein